MKATTTLPPFPDDGSVLTLGLQVIAWIEATLCQPDGDRAGEGYVLTGEQVNFICWWYAVDASGSFIYRRGVFRRSKGHGKSPFVAALCLAELCGPVRLDFFDEDGRPVGKPHPMPWVVVAGVSESQTANTLDAARAMALSSDLNQDNGGPLDIGKTRILHEGGGKLHSITASAASQEGARPTFAVADEPHHWTDGNGGKALARVLRRNLAKVKGRLLETTNAHEPGRDTVAEDSFLAHRAEVEGRTKRREILYDSREAPMLSPEQLADEPTLREALRLAYGDSVWVDLDPLIGEIYDPSTPVEEGRRFYLNHIVAAADSWLRPDVFGKCVSEDVPPLLPNQAVALGFDGALTDDSTALVAVRMSDGAPFLLGLWEADLKDPTWHIDKVQVRDAVDHAFATYRVVAFHADVAYWETDVDRWRDLYAERLRVKATPQHAVAWDMRGHQADTVRAVEALHRAFTDGEIPVFPDDRLQRHVLNARRRPNRWGVSFGKETRESPKKVDALAALVLARIGRAKVLAAPPPKTKTRHPPGVLRGR